MMRGYLTWIVSFLVLASCKLFQSSSTNSATKGNLSEGQSVYWNSTTIPVCWEESAKPYKNEREFVQNIVNQEYGRTVIRFVGWEFCPSSSFDGIRIQVADKNPQTLAIGAAISGIRGGLLLNFEYNDGCSKDERTKKSCMQVHALHEIGHAIGLRHEHSRSDSTCDDYKGSESNTVPEGTYDPQSIMNYCPNFEAMSAAKFQQLSEGDINTINRVYRGEVRFKNDPGQSCKNDGFAWNPRNCCMITKGKAPTGAQYYACITPDLCEAYGGTWKVFDNSISDGCCANIKESPFGVNWDTNSICKVPEELKGDL